MFQIIPRAVAKERGLTRYFSGNPCKQGHLAERYTGGGSCAECLKISGKRPERILYERKYYKKNRARVLERSRKYHERNRERGVENAKRWSAENPERRREISNNYKVRRRSVESEGMTTAEVAAWKRGREKTCHYCGVDCEESYHVDHFIPLSRGGAHAVGNLVIACPPCNQRKSSKMPWEFEADGEIHRVTVRPRL